MEGVRGALLLFRVKFNGVCHIFISSSHYGNKLWWYLLVLPFHWIWATLLLQVSGYNSISSPACWATFALFAVRKYSISKSILCLMQNTSSFTSPVYILLFPRRVDLFFRTKFVKRQISQAQVGRFYSSFGDAICRLKGNGNLISTQERHPKGCRLSGNLQIT